MFILYYFRILWKARARTTDFELSSIYCQEKPCADLFSTFIQCQVKVSAISLFYLWFVQLWILPRETGEVFARGSTLSVLTWSECIFTTYLIWKQIKKFVMGLLTNERLCLYSLTYTPWSSVQGDESNSRHYPGVWLVYYVLDTPWNFVQGEF